jgi:hypothetical protein
MVGFLEITAKEEGTYTQREMKHQRKKLPTMIWRRDTKLLKVKM